MRTQQQADPATRVAIFLCTCGYIGFVPFAPGTAGSLAGLALYWLLHAAGLRSFEWPVVALLVAAGIWSGTIAERYFGGADPSPVVIDEVAGMLIALASIPTSGAVAVLGFFVFRVLDVIKPYPSARLERLPGGLGVMADDVMAAVYSNLVVRGAIWLAPAWMT